MTVQGSGGSKNSQMPDEADSLSDRMPFFSMQNPPEPSDSNHAEDPEIDHEPEEALPPPIDFPQLSQRCLGNAEFAKRVLGKFDHGFGEGLREIEKQLAERNVNEIGRIAHRMKGAAANAAAPLLQQIIADMESFSQDGRVNELNDAMQRLKDEWARFKDYTKDSSALG